LPEKIVPKQHVEQYLRIPEGGCKRLLLNNLHSYYNYVSSGMKDAAPAVLG
jgi:hypothetical protein